MTIEPDRDWGSFATFLSILVFMAICFCAGALTAAAWSAWDEFPARGVMEGDR